MSPPIPHGTHNGYVNYGCRCDECRKAKASYERAYQEAPCPMGCGRIIWGRFAPERVCRTCLASARTIPLEARHGTETGYSKGCRCQSCRNASAESRQRRRKANPEATRAYERARYYRRKAAA